MASYLKDLNEREGLPPLRTSTGLTHEVSMRRVAFEDDRYSRPRSPPRSRSPRSKSPTSGLYGHRSASPLFQPRPPSPGSANRRQLQELQDQMKSMREEHNKKDALIQQLVSMDNIPKVATRPQPDIEHIYCGERQALESARSELAALQVKTEKQQNKIRELENELEIRDVKIKEMKMMTETSHENECRLSSVVESLRNQIADLEGRAGAYESVAGRGEVTISALQRESRAAQERIVDLETRQRKQLEEREEAQARAELLDRRLKETMSQFGSILRLESITGGAPSMDEITVRLSQIVEEGAMMKGKLMTLTDSLNNSELETKASRETIMRLVSEMGKEQSMQSRYEMELNAFKSRGRESTRYDESSSSCYDSDNSSRRTRSILKSPTRHRSRDRSHSRERDIERSARHELEREVTLLKERLELSQRTIESQRSELEVRENRFSSIEREYRSTSNLSRNSEAKYGMFVEQIANLIGDVDGHCTEDTIKRKIETIIYTNRDLRNKMEQLEDRVRQLTEQLETQYELHKTAAQRARKAETQASDMSLRLQSAEGELATGDVLRDGFRTDKEQYMRCLQQLGEMMKMDRISCDLGMDMTMDALIARAQQLVKLEKDTLADRSTHIYNLQRKVKALKEQLESKDLHIDLLRKKITTLEEKLLGKTTIERERDTETMRVRKAEKLSEKYKMQLMDTRNEMTSLKAQLLGSSELRVHTLEQRKELEELVTQVEELTHLRKKQAKKIHELKEEVGSSQNVSQKKSLVADNAVQALSSELKTTKVALINLQNREKQLIDFRMVVARMLGLDINTLAIPDYEIITRLEKLINAHHSHTFTTMSLEDALADMEDGFFSGYSDYQNTMGATESQNIRRSRERVKRKALKSRSRSMSPTKNIDPRVY